MRNKKTMFTILTLLMINPLTICAEKLGTATHGDGDKAVSIAFFGEKSIGNDSPEKLKIKNRILKAKFTRKISIVKPQHLILKTIRVHDIKTIYTDDTDNFKDWTQGIVEMGSVTRISDSPMTKYFDTDEISSGIKKTKSDFLLDDFYEIFEKLDIEIELKVAENNKRCKHCENVKYVIPNAEGIQFSLVCLVGRDYGEDAFEVNAENIILKSGQKSLKRTIRIGSKELAESVRYEFCDELKMINNFQISCNLFFTTKRDKENFNLAYKQDSGNRRSINYSLDAEEQIAMLSQIDKGSSVNIRLLNFNLDKKGSINGSYYNYLPFEFRLDKKYDTNYIFGSSYNTNYEYRLEMVPHGSNLLYFFSEEKLAELLRYAFFRSVEVF